MRYDMRPDFPIIAITNYLHYSNANTLASDDRMHVYLSSLIDI
jgi:hypothetical protein